MRIFNYIWNPLGLLERVALVQPFISALVSGIGSLFGGGEAASAGDRQGAADDQQSQQSDGKRR
mgnify:CR=1 FL=1